MSKPTAAQWAELDTSDIASINSADLNAHRPNRWTGQQSTWRTLTEHERSLYQSLKAREDQDLGTHLYNAFSLKKRSRDPALAEDLKIETEDGGEAIWAPPKMWTAWPLAQGRLPVEDFVARDEDEDEGFTYRMKSRKMPSDDLAEEISAGMLRMAKKRFLKRKKAWEALTVSVEDGDDGPSKEEIEAETEAETEADDMEVDDDDDGASVAASEVSTKKSTRTYEPAVSTNDDLSYKLLEPSTRHIIAKLDATLRILHHTRAFGASGHHESDFDASESEPPEQEEAMIDTDALEPKPKGTKRGRPRKVQIPLEGESREEMLARIARENHRRLPKLDKERAAEKRAAEAKRKADAAFHSWMEDEGQEESLEEGNHEDGSMKEDGGDAAGEPGAQQVKPRAKGLRQHRKLGLQDWSEVVGAAALAGFPPKVIARTVQRCSNLFGESMAIRTLPEAPHGDQASGIKTYRPEQIQLSDSEGELSEPEDDMTLERRRALSRRTSRMRSRTSTSPLSSAPRSRSASRSQSRTGRSRSASAGAVHYCPVPECERAATGFTRVTNLKRHLKLVHKGMTLDDASSPAQSSAHSESEVDSEDEMLGAVHVDGFLKPIVPSKGWRGEDLERRKRKRGWRKGRRGEETDDTGADASA